MFSRECFIADAEPFSPVHRGGGGGGSLARQALQSTSTRADVTTVANLAEEKLRQLQGNPPQVKSLRCFVRSSQRPPRGWPLGVFPLYILPQPVSLFIEPPFIQFPAYLAQPRPFLIEPQTSCEHIIYNAYDWHILGPPQMNSYF